MSSAEVLPTNFQVFRNDRSDSYGGVLIAVREDLICSPVLTKSDFWLSFFNLISSSKAALEYVSSVILGGL
jgi:hypothetical protein